MYDFIHSQETYYPLLFLCKVLQVGPSAYYAYRGGHTYVLADTGTLVETAIIDTFKAPFRRYGVRRLMPELRDQGISVGNYKIGKGLNKYGLKAIQPRSFVPKTTQSRHPYPISPNLLLNRPKPLGINQVLVGDITYIPLMAGNWAYLSVWLDLYSRKMVGWHLAEHRREELIIAAFKKALPPREISPATIIHSDRGGQYAGKLFRGIPEKQNALQRMSRADNPYDNAFMESYFSGFKAELLEGAAFESMEDAHTDIFEYIEMYYHPIRRHSSIVLFQNRY